jgi:hypothetical protein
MAAVEPSCKVLTNSLALKWSKRIDDHMSAHQQWTYVTKESFTQLCHQFTTQGTYVVLQWLCACPSLY